MVETKEKINRIIYYPGYTKEFTNEEKIRIKNKSRLIVLSFVLGLWTLILGSAAIVTLGHKLFGAAPILY